MQNTKNARMPNSAPSADSSGPMPPCWCSGTGGGPCRFGLSLGVQINGPGSGTKNLMGMPGTSPHRPGRYGEDEPVAEFRPNSRNVRTLLKSRQVGAMLEAKAQPLAQKIKANTPRSNRPGGGGTADSTKVQSPDKSLTGDRVRVRISQTTYSGRNRPRGGAAAPLQFGNAVTEQRSHMTRALGTP